MPFKAAKMHTEDQVANCQTIILSQWNGRVHTYV